MNYIYKIPAATTAIPTIPSPTSSDPLPPVLLPRVVEDTEPLLVAVA